MQATFFGHRDAPSQLKDKIFQTVLWLLEEKGVSKFLVGAEGQFDTMVTSVLKELKKQGKSIDYCVVLAYMPYGRSNFDKNEDTLFPEEIATALPRFAIAKRNEWMLKKSDIVVTFVKHTFGGAYQYKQKAIKWGKTVIELADDLKNTT